jgi:small subunit ribosomal protein S19
MVRSLKKGPFVAYHLLKRVENREKQENVATFSRDSTVVPMIIGYTIDVYNGKEYFPIVITDQIVGQKLGEFVTTRTFGGHLRPEKKGKRLLLLF